MPNENPLELGTLKKLIVLSTTILLNSSLFAAVQVSGGTKLPEGFLANLPPGEIVEPLPESVLKDPPVYLDVDSKGNVYTLYLVQDKTGNYKPTHELVTPQMLNELRSQREVILQNMEDISLPSVSPNQGPPAESSSACPLPSSFSIWGNETGPAMGFVKVLNTSRPPSATTQWVTFDFWAANYRDRGSHLPIIPFQGEEVHGWGSFIGDNHGHPTANCGDSARFNSQIEAWTQYTDGRDSGGTPIPGSRWQNLTFNGPNSCGNEMYNGPVIINWMVNPRYRFEMQASTGHWVAYRIMELKQNPLRWEVLTNWKVTDVDTGNWEFPLEWTFPPNDPNPNPQGIWFLATGAQPGAGTGSWSVNFVNTSCGWF